MSTRHLEEDLVAFVTEDMDDADRTRWQLHVDDCDACQAAVQETRQIFEATAQEALTPSPGFDRALFARLDAIDREDNPSFVDRLKAWWSQPRWVISTAVATAAVAALVVLVPKMRAKAPQDSTAALLVVAQNSELLDNLDVIEELELYEHLDVLDDLDVIESLETEEG